MKYCNKIRLQNTNARVCFVKLFKVIIFFVRMYLVYVEFIYYRLLSTTFVACLFFFQTTFPVSPSLATSQTIPFSPYMGHMSPGIGLMPELLPSTPVLVPGSPTGITMGNGNTTLKHARTDKLEVQQTENSSLKVSKNQNVTL